MCEVYPLHEPECSFVVLTVLRKEYGTVYWKIVIVRSVDKYEMGRVHWSLHRMPRKLKCTPVILSGEVFFLQEIQL